jgi:hypothetical protein
MIVHDVKQGTLEWLKLRTGIPTASEFSRIVTPKGWKYAADAETFIHELIAQRHAPDYSEVESYVSASMRNGMMLEPEARRYHEFTTGLEIEQTGFITTDDGRFGYSPDGLIGEDGLLECKSPKPKTQIKWLLQGGVPDEHLAQCHGGLLVTGRQWLDFLSYCHGLPSLLVRVERDEKTEALNVALERFHAELVATEARIVGMFAPLPTREVVTPVGSYTEEIYEPSYF